MSKITFVSVIENQGENAACEVPSNLNEELQRQPRTVSGKRPGFNVYGTLQGRSFESIVVSSEARFFVLTDEELLRSAGVEVGDSVEVVIETTSRGRR